MPRVSEPQMHNVASLRDVCASLRRIADQIDGVTMVMEEKQLDRLEVSYCASLHRGLEGLARWRSALESALAVQQNETLRAKTNKSRRPRKPHG